MHYNATLKLNDEKREILLRVREELRTRMMRRFAYLTPRLSIKHSLEFQTQGSFVMDTIITPFDDDYDLDDGVYFIGQLDEKRRPEPSVFHDWVKYSVGEDESYGKVTDKDTCVRVAYLKEKFHIDLPIYYADNFDSPDLAHLKENWLLSNPIEFIAWFEGKLHSGFQKEFILESKMFSEFQKWTTDIRKQDSQLRRIVRYLKGWGDHLREDMPPGIIMTILAAENYCENIREDIAMRDTLVEIQNYLRNNKFKCPRPTTPEGEDLFENYENRKKDYFKTALERFVDSANQAITKSSKKEACAKWQTHLGPRFPCNLIRETDADMATIFPFADRIRHDNKSA